MTDEVGAHVLAHNYAQTLALSLQEASAAVDLDAQGRFMLELEAVGRLDRKVEGLPRAAASRRPARRRSGPDPARTGGDHRLRQAGALGRDRRQRRRRTIPTFEKTLVQYFPTRHGAKFEKEMKRHRLRREIIATVLANTVVDMVGPTFASRLKAATGCTVGGAGGGVRGGAPGVPPGRDLEGGQTPSI